MAVLTIASWLHFFSGGRSVFKSYRIDAGCGACQKDATLGATPSFQKL
jgi:hypothetical protein